MTSGFLWAVGPPVALLFIFLFFVLPVWGMIDAAIRPDSAWRGVDQNKLLWLALQFFLWVFGSIAYFVAIRPKLRAGQAHHRPRGDSRASFRALAALLVLLVGVALAGTLWLRQTTSGREMALDTLVEYAGQGRISEVKLLDQEGRAQVLVVGQHDTPRYVDLPDESFEQTIDSMLENQVPLTIVDQTDREVARNITRNALPTLIALDLAAMLVIWFWRSLRRSPGQLAPSLSP